MLGVGVPGHSWPFMTLAPTPLNQFPPSQWRLWVWIDWYRLNRYQRTFDDVCIDLHRVRWTWTKTRTDELCEGLLSLDLSWKAKRVERSRTWPSKTTSRRIRKSGRTAKMKELRPSAVNDGCFMLNGSVVLDFVEEPSFWVGGGSSSCLPFFHFLLASCFFKLLDIVGWIEVFVLVHTLSERDDAEYLLDWYHVPHSDQYCSMEEPYVLLQWTKNKILRCLYSLCKPVISFQQWASRHSGAVS